MSKELKDKELKDKYRNACSYTQRGGVTKDSDGKNVDRYPSEKVMMHFLQLASSHSEPLSREIMVKLHKEAYIFVQNALVKTCTDHILTNEKWEKTLMRESTDANKDAANAKAEVESAQEYLEKVRQDLILAEARLKSAYVAQASAEKIAKMKNDQHNTAKLVREKSQEEAAKAAEELKALKSRYEQ